MDGSHLSDLLLSKGYKVFGMERRSSSKNRTNTLHLEDKITFLQGDLTDQNSLLRCLKESNPDEVYNLAAQSFVAASFEMPTMTSDVTGLGVVRILESIRQINPSIKFYQASSSEMFGKVAETPQSEKTLFHPRSPYGVAKLYGHWITVNYRDSYDLFACSGILFNHESPLRGHQFVTRKITKSLSRIKLGKQQTLQLGNIEAKRDWGFAGDYVKGMHLMLNHTSPDDYVLATNETHTVRKFIELACNNLSIDLVWEGSGVDEKGIERTSGKKIIEINPKYYRPAEVDLLLGDSSKAKKVLGWNNNTSFESLVSMMVNSDFEKEKSSK